MYQRPLQMKLYLIVTPNFISSVWSNKTYKQKQLAAGRIIVSRKTEKLLLDSLI